jgi:anti-sigma regulatory factor (Ser/Thr protein kinase)
MPGRAEASLPLAWQCCALQVLDGRPDQVRMARQVARQHLAGHPAAGDAVAVASELAANSVVHSASRLGSGQFLIRVTVLDGQHAAVSVTDQGGRFAPQATTSDGESGRGLAVVRSLSCLFLINDHDGLRTFTAIVPAHPDAIPPPPPEIPGQPPEHPATTRSAEKNARP